MSVLPKATVAQTNAIREGIKIVRKILAKHGSSNGLTTAELYQLALLEPAPQEFAGDPRLASKPGRLKGITLPPHNDHPIRSKAFLKQLVLPALEGSREVTKVVANREITTPIAAKGKKGKTLTRPTKESAGASSINPVLVKAWVWKPYTPPPPKPRQQENPTPFGASVGVGEDWSHLNRRRQGSREDKVRRDLAIMKRLRVLEGRVAQTS